MKISRKILCGSICAIMIAAFWVLAPLSVEAQTITCPSGSEYVCYVHTVTVGNTVIETEVRKGKGVTTIEF